MNLTKNNTLPRKNTKLSELLGGSFFGLPTEVRKKKLDLSKAAADIIDYVFEVFCRQSKNSAVFLLKNLQDEVKYSDNHLRKALRDINKSGALIVHDAGNKNFLIMVNNKGNLDYLDQVLRGEIIFENIKKPKSILSTIKDFFTLSSEQTEIFSEQIEISSEQTEIFSEQIKISSELSTITQNTDNKELQPLQKSCIDLNTIDHIYIDHHHIDKKNDDAFFQKESNEEEGIDLNDEESLNRILNEAISSLDDSVGKDYKKSSAVPVNCPEQRKELTLLIKNFDFEGIPYAIHQNKLNEVLDTYSADLIKKQFNYMLSRQNPKSGKPLTNPVGFFLDSLKNYDSYSTSSSKAEAQKNLTLDKEKNKEGVKKLAKVFGASACSAPWVIFGEIFVSLRSKLEYFTKDGKDDIASQKTFYAKLSKIPELVGIDFFRSNISDPVLYDSLVSILNEKVALA